ncbi:Ppx/GppA family phosphatase [Rhodohalobacter sp. SW132]|uniref:Ppx/GppA phosphatase family protein n=1 Tax=Rhodohalobacter sp. SW132 TaxID=2293433 RepID=UPI000E26B733|nr:Ppx/GppA phosphatase family protein [Rhodohalobacter sp. SW132]REL24576.1 Ppx/GppA family phosphatase [Rhodohalobacter sp. SW132]
MPEITFRQPVRRIAAIDLGTNSFHAVIVDVFPDGSFQTVDKLKEMVLLAEKGFANRLSDAAMERAMSALRKIKTLSDHQNAEHVLAYATSAIREAENGGELIQRAIDELGIKINAIPGRVEAELIGLAVQHGIKLPIKPVLMVDIGGGSVEFIIGDKLKFYHLASKKIGIARMTDKFVDSDPISQKEISSLESYYEEQLRDVAQAFATHRAEMMVGSSGTLENIGLMIARREKMSSSLSVNELEFSREQFLSLYDELIGMDRKQRSELSELDDKRIDLIAPGLILVRYILTSFGIKRVKISSQALREGIILRYIRREMDDLKDLALFSDPRLRSVMELVNRYDWHEEHSRHVAKIAVKLFDEIRDELELTDTDRELLRYAAFMHDIGYYISHRKHHKHALYIIRHSELLGFKEMEVEVMANVARYHRRSTPKMRHLFYKQLPEDERKRVKKLSALLRVADGLDRSHFQNVRDLKIERKKKRVLIELHTETDPQLEIWGAMRKRTLLEKVLSSKIEIKEAKTAWLGSTDSVQPDVL